MSCCNCKLKLISLIVSCFALFLQIFITSFNDIEEIKDSLFFKLIMCVLNGVVAFVNALSIGLKQKLNNEEQEKSEARDKISLDTETLEIIKTLTEKNAEDVEVRNSQTNDVEEK